MYTQRVEEVEKAQPEKKYKKISQKRVRGKARIQKSSSRSQKQRWKIANGFKITVTNLGKTL